MTEFFTQLWAAITSGDFQAILSLIAATAAATYPFWGTAVKNYIEKQKAKYTSKSAEVTELLNAFNISQETNKALLKQSQAATDAISKALNTLAQHSALDDETKIYITKLLTSVNTNTSEYIAGKLDTNEATEDNQEAEAEENKTTEESETNTPVGL